MKVSLEKAFSILDGRISTRIEDVYEMLNYIFDTKLYTHQLLDAMSVLIKSNPLWFSSGVALLEEVRSDCGTNEFEPLLKYIQENCMDYEVELEKI